MKSLILALEYHIHCDKRSNDSQDTLQVIDFVDIPWRERTVRFERHRLSVNRAGIVTQSGMTAVTSISTLAPSSTKSAT